MALRAISESSLSWSTRRTYSGTIVLLGKLLEFDPNDIETFRKRMREAETSYDAIKERWPDGTTRCRILTTILSILRLTNSVLTPRATTIWKHIHYVLTRNTARRKGMFSAREQLAWVPFEEIVAKRDALGETEYGSMQHLFLSFYTMWPPNRADFFKTYIFETEADVPPKWREWMYFKAPMGNGVIKSRTIKSSLRGGAVHDMSLLMRNPDMPQSNFIVLSPSTPREWASSMAKPEYVTEWDKAPRLVLLSHKTAGSHGRILRSFPKRLADVLRASLYKMPRNVLFARDDFLPFNSGHSFTVWGERLLERLFDGRRLGFNGLRHSYVSNVDFNLSSPQQLATLARDMGHSEYQQRRYTRGEFEEGRAPVLKHGGVNRT